jgi:hypothetical protein
MIYMSKAHLTCILGSIPEINILVKRKIDVHNDLESARCGQSKQSRERSLCDDQRSTAGRNTSHPPICE